MLSLYKDPYSMKKIVHIFLCLTLLLTSLPSRGALPSPQDLVTAFGEHKKKYTTFADINNQPLPEPFTKALAGTLESLKEPCAPCSKNTETPCQTTQKGKRLPQNLLERLAEEVRTFKDGVSLFQWNLWHMRLSLLLTFYPKGDFFNRSSAPGEIYGFSWVFFLGGERMQETLSEPQLRDLKDSVQTLAAFQTYMATVHPPVGPKATMGFSNGYANFLKDPHLDYVTGTPQNSYLMAFFGPLTIEDINTMFLNKVAPFGVPTDHLIDTVDVSEHLRPVDFTSHDLMHWQLSGTTSEHHSLLGAIRALRDDQTSRLATTEEQSRVLKETIPTKKLYEILFFLMHHEFPSHNSADFKAGNIFSHILSETNNCSECNTPCIIGNHGHLVLLNNFARILSEGGHLRTSLPRLSLEQAKNYFHISGAPVPERFDTLSAQGLITPPLAYFTAHSKEYPALRNALSQRFQEFQDWEETAMGPSFSLTPYVGLYAGFKALESADAIAYLWGKATGLPPLFTQNRWVTLKVMAHLLVTASSTIVPGAPQAFSLFGSSAMYALTQYGFLVTKSWFPDLIAFYPTLTLLFSLTPMGRTDPLSPYLYALLAIEAAGCLQGIAKHSEKINGYWKDQITALTSKSTVIATASVTLFAALSSALGVLKVLTPGNRHPYLREKNYIIAFFSALNLLALLV